MGLAAACVSVRAGGFQTSDVSASAKWVAFADCEAIKTTQIGTHILAKLQSEDAKNKLAAVQAMFNFDPRTDLSSVTLYGEKQGQSDAVAIVHGKFDTDRLVVLLKGNETYEAETFGARTIHSWIDDKAPQGGRSYGALAATGTVVIGRNSACVKQALDVLDGRAPALDMASVLGKRLPGEKAPMFVAGADLAGLAPLDPNAAVIQKAKAGNLVLSEQNGTLQGVAQLVAPEAQTAQQIQQVLSGMIAAGLLNAEQNPEIGRLAEATAVAVNGETVTLTLKFPVAAAIEMIDKHAGKAVHRRRGGAGAGAGAGAAPAGAN
jgi:hypothetical protein